MNRGIQSEKAKRKVFSIIPVIVANKGNLKLFFLEPFNQMTSTDFYNLSPAQQKAERLRQYADFFNSKAKDNENGTKLQEPNMGLTRAD